MKLWQEFKDFAFKGNVVDMAVGVVIGGAFGKIVSSIVSDLIMPAIGYLTAGADFAELKWVLSPAVVEGGEVVKAEAAILYGSFLQNVLDFFIIALSVFLVLRLLMKLRRKKKEEAPPPPAGPTDTELLAEIRDLLREKV
ncbi:large-conductance mechanosensitive channel protein MscL [Christensenellaceae bacterium NSJ-53]|uniref:Large-conductance mechanosensitive channel n=2 Tax=Gehongia tenuis TaxID=2763655 RepID=A0A926D2K3_9FIRM|nr:large-conductance mechanosensitive channel protein MscL [Gehongia tenuis]MBC8530588.1 large-conductance mechanosensitive channel protein MscL [Gehongia tenuis]